MSTTQGAELVARPVDCDVICLTCGKRYGDHYGPFCDHSDEQRLHGNRAFVPALRSPGPQAGEPSEEMVDRGARAGYAAACKTNGPLTLAKYASDDVMRRQHENARVIIRAALAQARVSIDIREDA
jgi:hypothetical protein